MLLGFLVDVKLSKLYTEKSDYPPLEGNCSEHVVGGGENFPLG